MKICGIVLLKNDKTGYAVKVLQSLGTTIALAPRLWFLEVANVLLVFERRKHITQAESGRFAELLTQLPIDVDDSVYNRVFDGVIRLARENKCFHCTMRLIWRWPCAGECRLQRWKRVW